VKELVRLFGKNGYYLSNHAQGINESPLVTVHELKSISQETTFSVDISDFELISGTIHSLAEQVGKRLRKNKLVGTTIKIKLRWADFRTITRQSKLVAPTDTDAEIALCAIRLFEKTWIRGKLVRLIGVGISDLSSSCHQLTLWEQTGSSQKEKALQLQKALDELRSRFGDDAIRPASKL
jgi:DNA polymerase IV